MKSLLVLALVLSACGLKAPPMPPSHEPPLSLEVKNP